MKKDFKSEFAALVKAINELAQEAKEQGEHFGIFASISQVDVQTGVVNTSLVCVHGNALQLSASLVVPAMEDIEIAKVLGAAGETIQQGIINEKDECNCANCKARRAAVKNNYNIN